MEPDGSRRKQLTFETAPVRNVTASNDGKVIAFQSRRSGTWQVWRMDGDGKHLRLLTEEVAQILWFGSDSATLWYKIGPRLWQVPVDGGQKVPLLESAGAAPGAFPGDFTPMVPSPDGRRVLGLTGTPGGRRRWFVVNLDGRDKPHAVDLPAFRNILFQGWTRDGRAITYLRDEDGVPNVWLQPLDGRPPWKLTSFTDQEVMRFAWSYDGRQLALARGGITYDLVMITSEEKK